MTPRIPPARTTDDSNRNRMSTAGFFTFNVRCIDSEFILPTMRPLQKSSAKTCDICGKPLVNDKTALNGSFAPPLLERGNGWIYCFLHNCEYRSLKYQAKGHRPWLLGHDVSIRNLLHAVGDTHIHRTAREFDRGLSTL